MPTFQSLFESSRSGAALVAGWPSASDKPLITPATANLASPDLVGFLNPIHPRDCTYWAAEVRYYSEMEPTRWQHTLALQVAGRSG